MNATSRVSGFVLTVLLAAAFICSCSDIGDPPQTTDPPNVMEKMWGTASVLYAAGPGEFCSSPRIAFDKDGNGIAVWSCNEIGLMASRYTDGAGWSAAGTIAGPAEMDGYNIELTFDNGGNAIVAWINEDLWTIRYEKTAGWGQPEMLAKGLEDVGQSSIGGPRLAIDGAGNAFAIWDLAADAVNPAIRDIWAARYTPAGGWEAPELLENSAADGGDRFARIACDADGNFMAVWNRQDMTNGYSIVSRLWTAAAGWEAEGMIDPPLAGSFPEMPNLVHDNNGAFIAVWMENGLVTSRYTTADGWTEAALVGPIVGEYAYPGAQICCDPTGDALVIIEGLNLWSASYNGGSGWSSVEEIPSTPVNERPRLAVDSDGNAFAVYRGYDQASKLYPIQAGRYSKDSGWESGPVRIQDAGDDMDGSSGEDPDVAFDSQGSAAAIWYQDNPGGGGSTSIWMNEYR